jgi:predicted nucleotidyltransferase
MKLLNQHIDEIARLCKRHKVKELYAFGSVLSDKFDDTSDVDLVVKFDELEASQYADNYYGLKFALQEVLQRQIDMLEDQAIKNPFFNKSIQSKRQLIYES